MYAPYMIKCKTTLSLLFTKRWSVHLSTTLSNLDQLEPFSHKRNLKLIFRNEACICLLVTLTIKCYWCHCWCWWRLLWIVSSMTGGVVVACVNTEGRYFERCLWFLVSKWQCHSGSTVNMIIGIGFSVFGCEHKWMTNDSILTAKVLLFQFTK